MERWSPIHTDSGNDECTRVISYTYLELISRFERDDETITHESNTNTEQNIASLPRS